MKFKIQNTTWEIYEKDEMFYILRNHQKWSNGNGPDYETRTEAEINILNEYRIFNEG